MSPPGIAAVVSIAAAVAILASKAPTVCGVDPHMLSAVLPKLYLVPVSLDTADFKEDSEEFRKMQTTLAAMQKGGNETLFELVVDELKRCRQSPKQLMQAVCSTLQMEEPKFGNALMLTKVNPSDFIKSKDFVRATEYLLHMASSIGLPSFVYLGIAAGHLDMEEDSMALHLEPGARHVARAMFDFLKTYDWKMASLIVSRITLGHRSLEVELKKLAEASRNLDDPNAYRFELTQVLSFNGLNKASEMLTCRRSARCQAVYRKILERLSKTEERIFLFHGSISDLNVLVSTSMNSEYRYLFEKDYLWLLSPAAIPSPPKNFKSANAQLGSIELPGLFGLTHNPDLTKAVRVATNLWYKALMGFKSSLAARGLTDKQIVRQMHPDFTCNTADSNDSRLYWEIGRNIYRRILNTSYCYSCGNDGEIDEIIGFDKDGFINTTELLVMNSRGGKRSTTEWLSVGQWSMSSSHWPQTTLVRMEGVLWPGNANTPPLGRPQKFRLRVATLKEDPFVRYWPPEKDGSCEVTALKCSIVSDNASLVNFPADKIWANDTLREIMRRSAYEDSCCTGLSIDLLKELMKDMDFEVDLFEVPDKTWGGWTATTGWNGLIRVLTVGMADMVVTALKITPNRSEQIDFSLPYQRTGITILVALREGAISTRAFLKPYDYPSWCLILVFSVHASGAALFLFEWLSPQGLDRGNVPPREHKFSLFRSLWLIWSMLFGAAVNADNPRGVASRFLGNIWALFALVFLASYTANLAAFMIAEESYYDLTGINDWRLTDPGVHRPPFRFATVPSGATEENVKMNFPEMANYMNNYSKSNVDEGIKALKNHVIDAFIYDATVLQYRVGKDKDCKLRTVGNWYSMTGYGIGMPKGSKWLRMVNQRILAYRRNGQLERWSNFWFTGACQKAGKLRNTNQTLGVKNFISAFILLIGGMLLCCVLLLLEHSFYRYMRPKLKEWDKYGCCGLVSISMGQLLSFEQSVNQTVDLIKHHKCRNPICETQLWKLRHELDSANRKVQKLEALISSSLDAANGEGTSDTASAGFGQQWGAAADYLPITDCTEAEISNRLRSDTEDTVVQHQLLGRRQQQKQHVSLQRHQCRLDQLPELPLLHYGSESEVPVASGYGSQRCQECSYEEPREPDSAASDRNERLEASNRRRPTEILYKHPSIRGGRRLMETDLGHRHLGAHDDTDSGALIEKESAL